MRLADRPADRMGVGLQAGLFCASMFCKAWRHMANPRLASPPPAATIWLPRDPDCSHSGKSGIIAYFDRLQALSWPLTQSATSRAVSRPLQQLLQTIRFNPQRDTLWLAGDLVNRGPRSLEVLRWAYSQRDALRVVLGNHDLHLLAVDAGHGKHHDEDTLQPILAAPDKPVLLDWLRRRSWCIARTTG